MLEGTELTSNSETMEVKIVFTFNGVYLGGKKVVTCEEIDDLSNTDKQIKVTEHKDIEDDGQTVTIKEVPETPTPEEQEKPTTQIHQRKQKGQKPPTMPIFLPLRLCFLFLLEVLLVHTSSNRVRWRTHKDVPS
ncbi:hypothetical protein BGU76_00150 [Clostridioides difficile]|nr:hypothetical protein [Clostridioides difficile]PBH57285.1 hypothetical protein BGU76_00150 [Clostridioides difficile]